ncbi:MAG TPA: hypothetical protein VJN96_27205 [Vicinamibacterales bacterium]|nr:hypothetical protein [Vicinamibacterales bacterium]
MEPPRTLIPVAALVLVVAMLGQRPDASERNPDPSGKASSQKHDAAPATAKAKGPSSTSSATDEPIKALDILAESFGVDISRESLERRLRRELGFVRNARGDDERVDDAKQLLAAFAESAGLRRADPKSLDAAISEYFRGIDQSPVKLVNLQRTVLQEVARRQNTPVRFLIATLPDPMDSFTGWQFDPMLDAIEQAVVESEFVFERHKFPDAAPDQSVPAAQRFRRHESESNVILSHRHREGEHTPGARDRELLVLLIVHENPSAGVHVPALIEALEMATSWKNLVPLPEPRQAGLITILGPTFSGSSESIVNALKMACRRQMLKRDQHRVWIVTGSATDDSNKPLIEGAFKARTGRPALSVKFDATVQPDRVVLPALTEYIQSAGWPRPIGVLFEGNTQYGRSLKHLFTKENGLSPSDLILLPFPLNVSHVRNTAADEKIGLAQALGLPSRVRPLSMETPAAPEDQIPQLTPSTTSSYVELGLSSLLQTMRTERVGTVAVMSTDPRDKLFLVRQLAHAAPNVALMTVESDSIYYHPDYAYYMQGTIVASTYPLYSGSQRWNEGFDRGAERHVFANGSSEGMYNAALLLLNYDTDGNALDEDAAPRLLDYSMPGEACAGNCQPPVWISVVGSRGEWPLRPSVQPVTRPYALPLPARAGHAARSPVLRTFPSVSFSAVFIVMTLFVAAICLDPRFRSGQWAMQLAGGRRVLSDDDDARRRYYAFVAVASVLSVEAYVVVVQAMRFRIEAAESIGSTAAIGLARLVALAASVPLAVLDVQLVRQAVRNDRAWLTHLVDLRHVDGWVRVIGTAVSFWAVGNLAFYTWQHVTLPTAEAASFVVRATNFASGVSPTLPIVFLFAALTLWGVLELARLRGPGQALADASVQRMIQQAISGCAKPLTKAWTELIPSAMRVRPALAWVVVIGVAGTCAAFFDPFVRPLVTIEGVHFGRFVSSTILLLQVMIGLALLQFVYLWTVLRRLLERLAYHGDADAYVKVPRGLFPPSLFPRMPGLNELEIVVEYRAACLTRSGLPGAPELHRVLESERSAEEAPHWTASETWKALVSAATVAPAPAGTAPAPDCDVLRLREMCVTLVVRDAIARLWHNVVFVAGAVLCVFFSHALFPFQLQRALSELGWFYVALAFGAIVIVLWQMRRNDFLRRVASPDPTRGTGWDTAFILRLAIFVLIPLLTLFAAQFPDTGGVLMRWLDPVRKFLP